MAKATSERECISRHEDYRDLSGTLNSLQRARLGEMVRYLSGDRILDIGCNAGYLMEYVNPFACEVHGVDVSHDLVHAAIKRGMRAMFNPAEKLPWEDGFFDSVVLGEILEHVYDPEKVFGEAYRVCKGRIIGSTPHDRSQWGEGKTHGLEKHAHHVRIFTGDELRSLLMARPFRSCVISTMFDRNKRPTFRVFCVEL